MNTMNDACVAKAVFNREHTNKSITYNPDCAQLLACKTKERASEYIMHKGNHSMFVSYNTSPLSM